MSGSGGGDRFSCVSRPAFPGRICDGGLRAGLNLPSIKCIFGIPQSLRVPAVFGRPRHGVATGSAERVTLRHPSMGGTSKFGGWLLTVLRRQPPPCIPGRRYEFASQAPSTRGNGSLGNRSKSLVNTSLQSLRSPCRARDSRLCVLTLRTTTARVRPIACPALDTGCRPRYTSFYRTSSCHTASLLLPFPWSSSNGLDDGGAGPGILSLPLTDHGTRSPINPVVPRCHACFPCENNPGPCPRGDGSWGNIRQSILPRSTCRLPLPPPAGPRHRVTSGSIRGTPAPLAAGQIAGMVFPFRVSRSAMTRRPPRTLFARGYTYVICRLRRRCAKSQGKVRAKPIVSSAMNSL